MFPTSVVKEDVPLTVNAALSVIAAPDVATRLPFTVPCNPKAVVPLSIVTSPFVPKVLNVTLPVMAFVVVSKVIALSLTSVVNEDVPPTVITPLSVITSPDVTAKFCPTDTVPRFTAVVPLSNVTSPVPVVVKLTAPVNAFVVVFKVMDLFATSVMKLDVPPTVITPLSVITSPDVTAKFCPTDTVPRFTAVVPLSNVTSPVPVVVKLTAPVNALVSRVIELFPTSVVKEDVPLTVNAALSVIAAPDVATRLPFTVPCNPKAVVPLSIVTSPFVPKVLNVTLPVMAFVVVSKVIALSLTSVVNEDVPPTVITPLSVITSPDVTAKFCPTDTVPRFTAVVPLSNVTSPVPVVVKLTAPVNAFVVVFKVMDLFATSVMKLDVPVTVSAPVCVIASLAVTNKLPATV